MTVQGGRKVREVKEGLIGSQFEHTWQKVKIVRYQVPLCPQSPVPAGGGGRLQVTYTVTLEDRRHSLV